MIDAYTAFMAVLCTAGALLSGGVYLRHRRDQAERAASAKQQDRLKRQREREISKLAGRWHGL